MLMYVNNDKKVENCPFFNLFASSTDLSVYPKRLKSLHKIWVSLRNYEIHYQRPRNLVKLVTYQNFSFSCGLYERDELQHYELARGFQLQGCLSLEKKNTK